MTTIVRRVKRWLYEPTPRIQMLPAYLIIGLGGFVILGEFASLSEQRVADARMESIERDYDTCVNRVETRLALRSVLLGITNLFNPEESRGARAVVELIESEYPALDLAVECAPILAGERP